MKWRLLGVTHGQSLDDDLFPTHVSCLRVMVGEVGLAAGGALITLQEELMWGDGWW